MKESQTEIRAIQAKLQALQMGHGSLRQSTQAIEPAATPVKTSTAVAATMPVRPTNERIQPDRVQPDRVQSDQIQNDQVQNDRIAIDKIQSDHPRESQTFRRIATEVSMAGHSTQPDAIPVGASQRQLQPLNLPEPPTSPLTETLQRLEAQAERVNQLSTVQEAALLELKAIAEQAERGRKALAQSEFDRDEDFEDFHDSIPIWECLETMVPLVERDQTGTFVVATRSIDLFKAEREALLTAQTLRHRLSEPVSQNATLQKRTRYPAAKRNLEPPFAPFEEELADWGQQLFKKISTLIQGRHSHRPSLRRRQSAPALTVQDAAIWIIGAIVARKGLDLLLAAVPALWLPVVGLIGITAAIAIYRTTFTPEFGFTWGYRLFLVMLGLLIGGRL